MKSERIPTPLVAARQREPVEIVEFREGARFRAMYVISRFIRYAVGKSVLRLRGKSDSATEAHRFRLLFEELGGLWIKVGQLISLRTDILSREMCDELGKLQYRAVGFPTEISRQTIEEQLGVPIEKIFSDFDDQPLAAASLSQVHRAVLRRGAVPVVVKVQRPDASKTFERDMSFLKFIFYSLDRLKVATFLRWHEFLDEIRQILLEEIDYRYEEANLRRMRKRLKEHKVHVPKVFSKYCGRKVLVMEFVDGVLMSDYIEMKRKDPEKLAAWSRENNFEPRKVARRLFYSAMRQLLEDNLFHADLHPGNVILLRDSRISLIDFGTVGSIEREFLQIYMLSVNAMVSGNFAKAADLALHMAPSLPRVDLANVRAGLIGVYRRWEARTHLKGISYYDKSLGNAGIEAGQITSANKIAYSWSFLKVSRTWTTMDASLSHLVPDLNYTTLFKKYFKGAEKRRFKGVGFKKRVTETVRNLASSIQEYHLLLSPSFRRYSLLYGSTRSKISRMIGVGMRTLRLALVLGAVLFLASLVHYHHLELDGVLGSSVVHDLIEIIPEFAYVTSLMILMGLFLIYRFFSQVIRILDDKGTPDWTG